MILTVTLNPAIDKIVVVPRFSKGKETRALRSMLAAGGKGVNVSRALSRFGLRTISTGVLAGAAGRWISSQLESERIPAKFSMVAEGETRMNVTLVSSKGKLLGRILEPGPQWDSGILADFQAHFSKLISKASFLVLSGGLPPGCPSDIYSELILQARKKNIPAILDASGDTLRKAILCRPFLIKPNREEAEGALKLKLNSQKNISSAVKTLLRRGAENAIISLGAGGAVAANSSGIWFAKIDRPVCAKHAVGCGDSMIAGFLLGQAQRKTFEESFRIAVAAGATAAVAEQPGQISLESLQDMLGKTNLKNIS